jgi:hypothetical protein
MARKSKARASEKTSKTRSSKRSSAKGSGSRGASRAEGGDGSDYRRKVRDGRLAQAKKGSCLPKLFMLLMPFAVLGTYFVLRS